MIRLADLMSLANRVLDVESCQASLSETKLGMVGPDEALDSHAGEDYGAMRRFVVAVEGRAEERTQSFTSGGVP
jgi:hypothetical protein